MRFSAADAFGQDLVLNHGRHRVATQPHEIDTEVEFILKTKIRFGIEDLLSVEIASRLW